MYVIWSALVAVRTNLVVFWAAVVTSQLAAIPMASSVTPSSSQTT